MLGIFNLRNFVDIYLLLLFPKSFVYKLFEIFMNFLNHNYPFEYSRGLFFHEATNQVKFALNCTQISTFKFEEDDPVWYDSIKRSLFPNLIVEWFIIPKSIAKHLIKRQHLQCLDLLEIHKLIEDIQKDGSVNNLRIINNYLVEHLQ